MRSLGYDSLPLDDAVRVWEGVHGPRDRLTLKAYFGTCPGTSTKVIDRFARYATGTVSQKKIVLREAIPKREGYLEKLGLVSFEKQSNVWFLLVNDDGLVVPEVAHSSTSRVKVVCGSNLDLSLTPKHLDTTMPKPLETTTNDCVISISDDNRERVVIEGEIKNIGKIGDGIYSKESSESNLSPLEEAILNAKPCESEKQLPKTEWPTEPFKPRFEEPFNPNLSCAKPLRHPEVDSDE
mgnify:FL=1